MEPQPACVLCEQLEDSVIFLYWTQTFSAAGHHTSFMLRRACLVDVRKRTVKREDSYFCPLGISSFLNKSEGLPLKRSRTHGLI